MIREASLRVPITHPNIGTYSALSEVTIVHKDEHGYTICLDNDTPAAASATSPSSNATSCTSHTRNEKQHDDHRTTPAHTTRRSVHHRRGRATAQVQPPPTTASNCDRRSGPAGRSPTSGASLKRTSKKPWRSCTRIRSSARDRIRCQPPWHSPTLRTTQPPQVRTALPCPKTSGSISILAVDMDRNPKYINLTDGQKWLIVKAIMHCREYPNDGNLPLPVWVKMGTKRNRISVESCGAITIFESKNVAIVHDYAEHNQTIAEIEKSRNEKIAAGQKGARPGQRTGACQRNASRRASSC